MQYMHAVGVVCFLVIRNGSSTKYEESVSHSGHSMATPAQAESHINIIARLKTCSSHNYTRINTAMRLWDVMDSVCEYQYERRFCKGSNFSTVKTRKFSRNLRVFTVFPYLFPGEVPSMSGLLQANLSPLLAAMLKTKCWKHTHAVILTQSFSRWRKHQGV